MESIAIQNKKFYSNTLFHDYIFSYEKLKKYFSYDFNDLDSFKKRAGDISREYNNGFRQKIAARLVLINKSFGCSEATIKNCNSLSEPDTLVVIGGQQPGLMTGPAFIIYKILSIIKLAEHMSCFLNLKVIPVFWNASDDSNFSQTDSTFLLDGELKKLDLSLGTTISISDGKKQKRFSDILISGDTVLKKIDNFLELLPETDFRAGIKEFFRDCLKRLPENKFENLIPEKSEIGSSAGFQNNNILKDSLKLNDFFSMLVTGLFSKYGVVLIDPSDIELKKLSLPLLESDICNHKNIENLINQAGKMLIEDGYHSQLSADKDFLNFFIVKDGLRKRIKCKNDSSYIFDGSVLSGDDLKSSIVSDFSKISLNVISRPLFQDSILPVLATVCGPGEVSYFAQLKQVYSVSGLKQPIIYPRFSATIVENKIKKAIEKTGLGFGMLNIEKKDAECLIAKKYLGIDIDNVLESLKDEIINKTGMAKEIFSQSGIEYGKYFDRLEDNLKKEIKTLSKKILSDNENKKLILDSSIDKIYLNLFPAGKLQERVINIFSYINKYDFKFLQDLYDIIDIEDHFHKLLFF